MTKYLIKKKPLNKDILVKLDKNEIEEIISKYPSNRKSSAVLPLLHLVQKKAGGWLPVHEMERVANILDMSYMRVYGPRNLIKSTCVLFLHLITS